MNTETRKNVSLVIFLLIFLCLHRTNVESYENSLSSSGFYALSKAERYLHNDLMSKDEFVRMNPVFDRREMDPLFPINRVFASEHTELLTKRDLEHAEEESGGELQWTTRLDTSQQNWKAVACDASGRYVVAVAYGGSVYRSEDSGQSFLAAEEGLPSQAYWKDVSCAGKGGRCVAVEFRGYAYISEDYGSHWKTAGGTASFGAASWSGVSVDSTGQYIVSSILRDGIYTSSDAGITHEISSSAPRRESYYAVCTSGRYASAVVFGGGIHFSLDYSQVWSLSTAPDANWYGITCASTGEYQYAIVYGGGIYRSESYGREWQLTNGPRNLQWNSVATSSDGIHVVASINLGGIVYSSDRGDDWRYLTTPSMALSWRGVAMVATGAQVFAVAYDGSIFVAKSCTHEEHATPEIIATETPTKEDTATDNTSSSRLLTEITESLSNVSSSRSLWVYFIAVMVVFCSAYACLRTFSSFNETISSSNNNRKMNGMRNRKVLVVQSSAEYDRDLARKNPPPSPINL